MASKDSNITIALIGFFVVALAALGIWLFSILRTSDDATQQQAAASEARSKSEQADVLMRDACRAEQSDPVTQLGRDLAQDFNARADVAAQAARLDPYWDEAADALADAAGAAATIAAAERMGLPAEVQQRTITEAFNVILPAMEVLNRDCRRIAD